MGERADQSAARARRQAQVAHRRRRDDAAQRDRCARDLDRARAEVGDIVATLKDVGRQHALVVDRDPLTHEETLRGIFSATQIGRQLGVPILIFEVAHTFAEIESELAK